MLIYLANHVPRDYGRRRIEVQTRRGWEFQAVVKGAISLLNEDGPGFLHSDRLWLSAPQYPHGWTGESDRPAQVIVFHFLFVPKIIEDLLRSRGCLEIPLSARDRSRLKELANQAEDFWQRPSLGMTICFEHVLLELSLLILAHHRENPGEPLVESSQSRVNAAIDWFTERIADNPDLPSVARALGTSTSNLRRLFQEVLQASPKSVFDQLRFQRAMQLMSDSRIKLETVGEMCGFGSASSFSRAFKIKFGCSPEAWRLADGLI